MSENKLRRVCVMSIHPKWANEIYQGVKRWEFRRKAPPPMVNGQITQILLYETAPVQKITGTFMAPFAITGEVEWLRLAIERHDFLRGPGYGSLTHEDLIAYAQGKPITAMSIQAAIRWEEPIDIKTARPPQSWMWCDLPF